MARYLVVHDDRDELYVELTYDTEQERWDGSCSDLHCPFTVAADGRSYAIADALALADVHLDHPH